MLVRLQPRTVDTATKGRTRLTSEKWYFDNRVNQQANKVDTHLTIECSIVSLLYLVDNK
jgi:hypothetical protein